MTKQEAGKLGGLATVARHGREYMAQLGKAGAAAFWAKYTLIPCQQANWAIVDRTTGTVKALTYWDGRK